MAKATVAGPDVATIAARLPAGAARGTSREAIAGMVTAIVERFRPARVVLFGSRASGTARPRSDVDLLVVLELPEETPQATTRRAEEIRAALGFDGAVWVHPTVRTPEQIRVGLAEGDFFVEEMMEGVVLFEGGDGGEMGQGDGSNGGGERQRGPLRLDRAAEAWVAKAEADDRAAARVALPPPEFDLVCFLSQQGAEKWLKALLQERGVRFGRTHDLGKLAEAAGDAVPGLASLRAELTWLSGFAVSVRYPGVSSAPEDAERALAIAGKVRQLVGEALGLSGR